MLKITKCEDPQDAVNYLNYLAHYNENILSYSNMETASKIAFESVRRLDINYKKLHLNILDSINENRYFEIEHIKIYVASKRNFRIILLNALRNFDLTLIEVQHFHCYLNYILKNINILNYNSLLLLKTLHHILLKRPDVLTTNFCYEILLFNNFVILSPFYAFKQYAHLTSRIAFNYIHSNEKNLIYKLDRIPFKSLNITDVVNNLASADIEANKKLILNKICELFKNNMQSKDASILYEKLLQNCSFDVWQVEIWPHFLKELQHVEFEGEYFQSYVKYWITSNVKAYREDFYKFMCKERVDLKIKGYILLEIRKKGYFIDDREQFEKIFYNLTTADIGLKIASAYCKQSLCPKLEDQKILLDFLYSYSGNFLCDEDVKCLKLILSQLVLYAHNDLKKIKDRFQYYANFLNELFEFCYRNLATEFFEVGAYVLTVILDILTGCHKDLTLIYKLEQKNWYDAKQNLLYVELQNRNCWMFNSSKLMLRLKYCFIKNQVSSSTLTNLLNKHYTEELLIDNQTFVVIFESVRCFRTLHNIEKIENCALHLCKLGTLTDLILSQNIDNLLIFLLENCIQNCKDEIIYQSLLYFSILTVAFNNGIETFNYVDLLNKNFYVIRSILQNESLSRTKVVETFINKTLECLLQNIDYVWHDLDKNFMLNTLITIIEVSNMKKCVTLSSYAVNKFVKKFDEKPETTHLKFKLLQRTLDKLHEDPSKNLKIRRNPQTRLVIHAVCSAEQNAEKPILKWSVEYLLNLLENPDSSDYSVAAALHSLEILILDNNLQSHTSCFISHIIQCSVEIFIRPNWIVRNADLQLIKAVLERYYGVSMGLYKRPKCIGDLFMLFPNLAKYFFQILSLELLDGRALIVFQFFIESQINNNIFTNKFNEILEYFRCLFVKIIKEYPNNFGKWAALCYVSLTRSENIIESFEDLIDFIKYNFNSMKKTVFANLIFLLDELYVKFLSNTDFDNNEINNINSLLGGLASFLKRSNPVFCDFILLKILNTSDVVDVILNKNRETNFMIRLFMHNYVPFLFINIHSEMFSTVLQQIFSLQIPDFIHIKILMVLIDRVQKGNFSEKNVESVINVLFENSTKLNSNYLSTCYFKILLVLNQHCHSPVITINLIPKPLNNNLYDTMIYVLYSSLKNSNLNNHQELINKQLFSSIYTNEETNNDIIAVAIYLSKITGITSNLKSNVSKLIFYHSPYHSTHLEVYNFISIYMKKSYGSVLHALKEFLSKGNIAKFINDEIEVELFFGNLEQFVRELKHDNVSVDGFYDIEYDNLIPFEILPNLVKVVKNG